MSNVDSRDFKADSSFRAKNSWPIRTSGFHELKPNANVAQRIQQSPADEFSFV